MAQTQIFRPTTQSALTSRFDALVTAFRARRAKARVFHRTLAEMAALSDRDLADLGLHRSEIRRVAYNAAYDR